MAEAIPRDGVHVEETRMHKLLDELERVDYETWHTIYKEGFEHCYWPDCLIQGIIQGKVLENGWELHQQSGGIVGYRATVTKWVRSRSERFGLCWMPVFEVVGIGDSNAEAILDAYTQVVRRERI